MATGSVKAVTSTAAALITSKGGMADAPSGVAIYPEVGNTQTVYVGGSDVTTVIGFPVPAAGMTFDLEAGDTVWAVTVSGSQNIRVFTVGNA